MGKTLNKNRSQEHKCGSCSKSFTQACHLKFHIHTVHEGHKDYKCESCGKSYSTAKALKMHNLTIHEGQKRTQIKSEYNICDSCGKSVSDLKSHIKFVHEGIKDIKCELLNLPPMNLI